MDGAREMVQAICRNTAPLAKLIDYQEEDAASMAKEMAMWQAEAKKYRALLVEETRETDRQIAPLEEQLRQMGDEAAALVCEG